MEHRVITDYTNVNVENAHVKVYVRARPPDKKTPTNKTEGPQQQTHLSRPLTNQASAAGAGASAEGEAGGGSEHFQVFPEDPRKLGMRDPSNTNRTYGEHVFLYDRVFWTATPQEAVFHTVCKPQVDRLLEGFNCCAFAYGQTGSGKTYTMFGEPGDGGNRAGMIPRCAQYLFAALRQRGGGGRHHHHRPQFAPPQVSVSLMEIYCDQIRDLGRAYLRVLESEAPDELKTSDIFTRMASARAPGTVYRVPSGVDLSKVENAALAREYTSMNFDIHESPDGQVFVKGLAEIPVSGLAEVNSIVAHGLRLRATHETKMNQVSSRSHTIFSLRVDQAEGGGGGGGGGGAEGGGGEGGGGGGRLSAVLHLVDLAGSERLKKSESTGLRLREALHINTSLTALGKVVMALDPKSERSHVPYRDSKLTRALQNSLGGNCYTSLLATIHPVGEYAEECLSTLQFANRCRSVQNVPRVNRGEGAGGAWGSSAAAASGKGKIAQLLREIALLKRTLAAAGGSPTDVAALLRGVAEGQASTVAQTVLRVLSSLGLGGQLLEDGSIQLADGRLIASMELAVDGGGTAAGGMGRVESSLRLLGSQKSLLDGEGFLLDRSGAGAADSEFLKLLQKEKEALKSKHDVLKQDHKRALQEVEDLKKKQLSEAARFARAEGEYKAKVAAAERRAEQLQQELGQQHQMEVQSLLKNNESILHKQHQLLQNVPSQLLTNAKATASQAELEKIVREEAQHESQQQLRTMQKNWALEVDNLRRQNEYWTDLRRREAEKFAADFNRFREDAQRKLGEVTGELLVLWDYGARAREVLAQVAAGAYPVQRRGARAAPLIPPGVLPAADPFADRRGLRRARAALRARGERAAALGRVEARAAAALLGEGGAPLGAGELAGGDAGLAARRATETSVTLLRQTLGLEPGSRPGSAMSSGRSRPASAGGGGGPGGALLTVGRPRASAAGAGQTMPLLSQRDAQSSPELHARTAKPRLESSPSRRPESAGGNHHNHYNHHSNNYDGFGAAGREDGFSVHSAVSDLGRSNAFPGGGAAAQDGGDGGPGPAEEQELVAGDVSGLGKRELRGTVEGLRAYIKRALPERVRAGVAAELGSHQTVRYLRALEEERDRYHRQMQEQARQLTALRVAHTALQRTAGAAAGAGGLPGGGAKAKKAGGGGGVGGRPRTAQTLPTPLRKTGVLS